MGQYYAWVNVDKKEFIAPVDFDLGSKRWESMEWSNPLLKALYALLADDWKGDHILFLGDQCRITDEETNPLLKRLRDEQRACGVTGFVNDMVEEYYHGVSAQFKDVDEDFRHEMAGRILQNDFEGFPYRPTREELQKGLFWRDGETFTYVVNETRREFYSAPAPLMFEDGHRTVFDALPYLMAYGGPWPERKYVGLWIGDVIRVTDDHPGQGYRDFTFYECPKILAEDWGQECVEREERFQIKRELEERLKNEYEVSEPVSRKWDRCCFVCNGLYFRIDTMGGKINGIVVEYADNEEQADVNLFEDGDVFFLSDYNDRYALMGAVLAEIENEIDDRVTEAELAMETEPGPDEKDDEDE